MVLTTSSCITKSKHRLLHHVLEKIQTWITTSCIAENKHKLLHRILKYTIIDY